ncbi:SHC-transforming protein 1 isoform X3 [Clarias magur]|uniref:SHC-transforming protein 1 isoform X3 n=1 Tax=Clarias magur TaxID=1594786 RepID=A0A8J4U3L2_CLAMG|nr:SHC-transforming protein 1 isoform X3 [Clarias magur]
MESESGSSEDSPHVFLGFGCVFVVCLGCAFVPRQSLPAHTGAREGNYSDGVAEFHLFHTPPPSRNFTMIESFGVMGRKILWDKLLNLE